MKKQMYMNLFHGRNTKDEVLDDWGFMGPAIGPLEFYQITYGMDMKFGLPDPKPITERLLQWSGWDVIQQGENYAHGRVSYDGDLIVFGDCFFGDLQITVLTYDQAMKINGGFIQTMAKEFGAELEDYPHPLSGQEES